jgi:hypothetical protein
VADIALSYGYPICELGKSSDDIVHYSQPMPKFSNPILLPAKFADLNKTMPIDISFIPMISQNIDDTDAGRSIKHMFFNDSSAMNRKAGIKYKPDTEAIKTAIYNMINKYGWDVHANINIPDKDTTAPIGMLPVFNIDQFIRACKRLLMLANVNKWDYVLLPYVNTQYLSWEMIRSVYESILDSRFIISDESLATEATAIAQAAGKLYPTCCAIGHKPGDMFANNAYKASTWAGLEKKLHACIKQLINEHGTKRFISGGAQGIEQLFYAAAIEASEDAGIESEVWLYEPFKGYSDRWPDSGLFSKSDYNRLMKIAKNNKTHKCLSHHTGTSMDKKEFAKALHEKNNALIQDSDIIIGICKYDISDITGMAPLLSKERHKSSTVQTLQKAYSLNKPIITIHPETLVTTRICF